MLANYSNTDVTNTTDLSNLHVTDREKWIGLPTLLTAESPTLNIKARNKFLSEPKIHRL